MDMTGSSLLAECPNIHVTLEYDEEGKQQIILNGENVTGYYRKEGSR